MMRLHEHSMTRQGLNVNKVNPGIKSR